MELVQSNGDFCTAAHLPELLLHDVNRSVMFDSAVGISSAYSVTTSFLMLAIDSYVCNKQEFIGIGTQLSRPSALFTFSSPWICVSESIDDISLPLPCVNVWNLWLNRFKDILSAH